MDARYDFTVTVDCAECGGSYDVPAERILESHALLERGCPGTSDHECIPAFYASLASRARLESMALARRSASSEGDPRCP